MVLINTLKKETYLIKDIMNKRDLESLKSDPIIFLSNFKKKELVNLIQILNYSYYIDCKSLVSDDLYEHIKNKLYIIDPLNPLLKNIGVSNKNKLDLPYHMGSMDKDKNTHNLLTNWVQKYNGNGYVLSDKLDGLSALYVNNNNTKKLFTRKGIDISHLINFIKGLPNTNNNIEKESEIAVRGELIISKENFKKIKVEGVIMNVRNVVSGVITAKKPNLEILEFIEFVSYEVIRPELIPSNQFKYLKNNNYQCVYNECINDINVEVLSNFLKDRREHSNYNIDGIIITNDSLNVRNKDGNPKYSFAFKNIYTLNKVEVMVLKVDWNITKDNYIQPVIVFDGIEIDGVIVKRATGKNGKFIMENNIGPGSKIIIVRRGDVIPHVQEILSASETGKAQMPEYKYKWNDTEVEIIVDTNNEELLKERNIKNMENFIVKMEFKGISIGIIKKLYNANINTIYKFINVDKDVLLNIEGIKEKKANNILESIKQVMDNVDCIKLMMSSNSFGRGLGKKKIKLIIDNITDKSLKLRPTMKNLISINGIEKKTAEKFIENIDNYLKFLEDTQIKCNFNVDVLNKNDKFKNINIVFTGIRDKLLENRIEEEGGSIKNSITNNIDYLIVKDHEAKSSKIDKAIELGIKIITIEEFNKKFN